MKKSPVEPLKSEKGGTKLPPALINNSGDQIPLGQMPEAEIRTIRQAQAGDAEAFHEILKVYQRPIVGTLYRFLGGRFSQEVEDYAQDVFLKVFRSIGKFDFQRHTKFSTWIYTFVRNYCIDILKKKRLETFSIEKLHEEDSMHFEIPGKAPTPSQELTQSELGKEIETAVGSLPEDQRQIFILREYQEMKYGEIAKVMNCSEGTIKSRLYRARETLRVKLSPYLRGEFTSPLPPEGRKREKN